MNDLQPLLDILKGKLLEISVGDEYEELILNESYKKVAGVIYGILQNIVGQFFVLNCFFLEKDGKLSEGNIVYVNFNNINAFTEVNSKGCLNDVMLGTNHTKKIKRMLKIK